ncbi:MAG: hypothetical protein ABI594_13505 [Ginsengibacter sp.]
MIQLSRVRTAPPVHKNFYGTKREELNYKLLKLKRDGVLDSGPSEDKWDSSIWKEAKDQLLAETHNKCAYCETPTKVIAYGDVEHFRPKSKYWWLAYSYENYLASCTLCNQKFKSDGFLLRDTTKQLKGINITPAMTDAHLKTLAARLTVDPIKEIEGMAYQDFENELMSEWALLVHPYYEDPAEYYGYKPILETREVHVVPTKNEYKDVVDAADTLFGINRLELLDLRFQWYCLYMTCRHTLADNGISANTRIMNKKRLDDMLTGYEAYTGMVRYFETQTLETLPWRFDISAIP